MRVLRPQTFDEALDLKAAFPEAIPVAGGTDLCVCWPTHPEALERTYLDLHGVEALRAIDVEEHDLVLGAGATYWDTLLDETCAREFPILLDAARQVGAIQIQSRGTWAGNVANASPAADGVAALMAHDAQVVLASTRGERRVALDGYFIGYRRTIAQPDELIRAIRVPRRPHAFSAFEKVGARRAQTITKVGVAMARSEAGWRIVAISLAPTVRRCRHVEALAAEDGLASRAALEAAIAADVQPIDDVRSTAAYRLEVFRRLVVTALAGG